MSHYFYLLHLLQPQIVSIQVPMYIEAIDIQDALQKASAIKLSASAQFQLLFEPSDPVMLVQAINGPSFGTFFSALGNAQNNIHLNMPVGLNINLYQFHLNQPLKTLEARVLVGGSQQAPVYSL